jgi:hypothetical protein
MSGKSLTFFNLFNQVECVDIPIIQRDYAQGRQEAGEVRSLFLRSLFNALTQESSHRVPLDLDFVYGSYEHKGGATKVFSVLDGQQRLTTLFLLHWYLAVADKQLAKFKEQFVSKSGHSRFTYKTRPSTTEFFDALVNSDLNISTECISTTITDCQWFYLSWEQDPTVQACLCMLKAIQSSFAGSEKGLFDRLTDINYPYITFQFLDLHSFGLSDELYIKMNARGKPLTVFENFKAKLEQYIATYKEPWPDYRLPFHDGVVDGHKYFIHKIDTDWADLFWPYRNLSSEDNAFDDVFMNFFRLIIMIQALLDNKEQPDKLAKITQEIFGAAGRLKEPSLSKYDELGCFSQALIVRFIQTIDLIYGKGLENNHIQTYLDDRSYYAEAKVFKHILSNSADYNDKLRFFAFYSYLANNKDLTELTNWMRVIYNLVENTITDSPADFYRALFVIHDLCQIKMPILQALKGDYQLSVFQSAQVLEEKIKAHLILKSKRWNEAIIEAESHTFFKGQIGSVLNFAGVLAFYRKENHCDWGNNQDDHYYEIFASYFNALAVVFNQISQNSADIDYAWERAVLSKGIYCTEASQSRQNLLYSQDRRNNIPRDHSWRRRMRIGNKADEAKQMYVKAVLDDSLFDEKQLKNSLQNICNQALNNPVLEEWRSALIKYPALFDYCQQGFIVLDADKTVLLSQSQRNHYHCELFTKVLELELKAEDQRLQPFTLAICESVKSRDDNSEVRITGCVVNDLNYRIVIKKITANFSICFKNVGSNVYPDSLVKLLDLEGMTRVEVSDSGGIFYHSERPDIEQTKNQIFDLCSRLMTLQA